MNPIDQDVAKLRREKEKQIYYDLQTGMYAGEEFLQFAPVTLLDGKFKVLLPTSFSLMSGELARLKYPSENRPQVIYTDDTGEVNFAFSCLPGPVNAEQIIKTRNGFRVMIKKWQPSAVFYDSGDFETNGKKVAHFSFKSHGLDGPLHHTYMFTTLEDNLMHGVFNCLFKNYMNWKRVLHKIMESFEEIK